MPPIRTKKERLSSIQPVNLHPQWSDGEFSLISKGGTTFKVASYHLQSASSIFRDLLAGEEAPKEVVLDNRAATVHHFLQIVKNGKPKFEEIDDFEYIDQVVELAALLDKYKCEAALYTFLNIIKTVEPVPPLILFAVGARLQQSKLCAHALSMESTTWERTRKRTPAQSVWKHPKFTARNSGIEQLNVDMMLPSAIPCTLYLSFPPQYAWALAVGPSNPKSAGSQCNGKYFLGLLKIARQKVGEGADSVDAS